MIPCNFERLELHHYQSNKKSKMSGVLENDESFKLGTFHQDLSYHSNEALVDLGEGPIGPPSPPFFLYFQNVLRFRFFFQNVNVTLPCITNTPTMLFKELKTDGKSFIFAVCRLTYDLVTSSLISLLSLLFGLM